MERWCARASPGVKRKSLALIPAAWFNGCARLWWSRPGARRRWPRKSPPLGTSSLPGGGPPGRGTSAGTRMPNDGPSRPPWVPFFCKDWMAKTVGLSLEEEGAFVRLFNAARTTSEDWCSLPNDDRKLARIVGCGMRKWLALRISLVPEFFFEHQGRLVNERLRQEAEKQTERREQQSFAGRRSSEVRANIRSTSVGTSVEHPAQRKPNHAVESAVAVESASDSPALQSLSPDSSLKPQGRKSNTLGPRASHSPFAQPSRGEVADYCAERLSLGKPRVDPDAWLDHYASNGWRVGKSPMRDWRAAVRTWERNGMNGHAAPRPGFNAKGGLTADAIGAFAKHLRETEARDGKG